MSKILLLQFFQWFYLDRLALEESVKYIIYNKIFSLFLHFQAKNVIDHKALAMLRNSKLEYVTNSIYNSGTLGNNSSKNN